MTLVFLIFTLVFYPSTGKQGTYGMIQAPSIEACQSALKKASESAQNDLEVSGFSFQCVTVPVGGKV